MDIAYLCKKFLILVQIIFFLQVTFESSSKTIILKHEKNNFTPDLSFNWNSTDK